MNKIQSEIVRSHLPWSLSLKFYLLLENKYVNIDLCLRIGSFVFTVSLQWIWFTNKMWVHWCILDHFYLVGIFVFAWNQISVEVAFVFLYKEIIKRDFDYAINDLPFGSFQLITYDLSSFIHIFSRLNIP